ncbi:MAG: hypothetical protein M3P26_03500 [Gemmatimonadota bacterium]|nr:hypothetical protein [Gemmatimonadota bacterium]
MSHLSEEKLDQLVAEERARQQQPLNDWRTIAARAREEGLIRESSSRGWVSGQPWVQAAAAVLLLIGGIAIGRTTIALPSATQGTDASPTGNAAIAVDRGPDPVPASSSASATFASLEEASATLDRAVGDYKRATEFLAANNYAGRPRDSVAMYSARLAALDKVINATESALQTAPHDPVINQYYLATMGARVATQQMVARPVALRGF